MISINRNEVIFYTLFIVGAALFAFDCVMTIKYLRIGVEEANPVMNYIIHMEPLGTFFILAKTVSIILWAFLSDLAAKKHKFALVSSILIIGFYLSIAIKHIDNMHIL